MDQRLDPGMESHGRRYGPAWGRQHLFLSLDLSRQVLVRIFLGVTAWYLRGCWDNPGLGPRPAVRPDELDLDHFGRCPRGITLYSAVDSDRDDLRIKTRVFCGLDISARQGGQA